MSLDVTSPGFKARAHDTYAQLRERQPVCRVTAGPFGTAVLVTRYADVAAMLKDPRLAKDPANALTPAQMTRQRRPPRMFAPLMRNMLSLDDPDHARLRRLVQAGFTPRRVEQLEAKVETASRELLDGLDGRASFDLVAGYALPLPVAVISDLLGVPKADQARFARWSHALIRAGTTPFSMLLQLPGMLAFLKYLKQLIAAKRSEPADDLVTALVRAEDEGGRLSGDELMAMVAILLSAGHETTTNLIGNGTLALMQHPAERERLQADPGLTEAAVEELLRFASPIETSTTRWAREDMEIAGQRVERGELVLGAIASANRDDAQFNDAGRLDLGRSRIRHLTFGEGGHYCVGAALARMEGRVAFRDLLARWPRLWLTAPTENLRWKRGLVLRGLERLPMATA